MFLMQKYSIGYDVGSAFVKASLIDLSSGKNIASFTSPEKEMKIHAPESDWAEQEPEVWWENVKTATKKVIHNSGVKPAEIGSIGISYQMHGLVLIDKNKEVIRPSIIWCDSRAVEVGEKTFREIGPKKSLEYLLNSPGNFTASKLKWIKENEPELFERVHKILLPGDYISLKLTNEATTTYSGLSEGILWDFKNENQANFLLDYLGISHDVIPDAIPNFSRDTCVSKEIAEELGIPEGIPVSYRAGDQPNNALSLNVLKPGEIAATAGTSGVVYGVSDEVKYDPQSRVNTFLHVNHTQKDPRLGVLLCINGTGSLNAWLKRNITDGLSYEEMNAMAAEIPPGSEGLSVLPFGNGAERVLSNANPGCQVHNLNFNIHSRSHLIRASQEGIVFTFKYGIDIMREIGITPSVIRAGNTNMFLSPVFRQSIASVIGARIELYDTDGAQGAARGAAIGAGFYKNYEQAFETLHKIMEISPEESTKEQYQEAYNRWKAVLDKVLS